MNDENDKTKSEDWAMTMPHLRLEKNRNADDFSDDFAPHPYSANQPLKADWDTTQQNFNPQNSQPTSDFDKTLPNINISRDVRQDESSTKPRQSSGDDWGMTTPNLNIPREQKNDDWAATAPNINVQQEDKHDDWEMTAPNINIPKQEKRDDWSMPAPVFRVSEGEKVDNLPKRTVNFNRNETDNYDKTTPNFNLSEISPPYPYGSTSPKLDSPSNVSKPISANQTAATIPQTEKAAGSRLIYVLGGLIGALFFAIVALALVYFLFLRQPEVPQRVETHESGEKNRVARGMHFG